MKFVVTIRAGGALISVPRNLLLALTLVASGAASAQALYKYQDENGDWVFTDRAPEEGQQAEIRVIDRQSSRSKVMVTHELVGDELQFTAHNGFYAPMEVALIFDDIKGIGHPSPDERLRWVVPAKSDLGLIGLQVTGEAAATHVEYHYAYIPGDPSSRHLANNGYRVPYAVGNDYRITQAYPDTVTHGTADSRHAIDIAMPVGTDIVAARGGTVIDVASDNYRGGFDIERAGAAANFVRVLHDDGTFAVYVHLNLNSVRVRPGDRISAGEYIADSGNTGFSSGPHLHFAVQRNAGMKIESVPVVFRGPGLGSVVPATGVVLTAYP